ncbi:hypothetical protein [Streptomyces sp. NPDC048157]|uniref:hypothetical protein n=1 Tax=Streptomyces sp. NPDC048157 TaxID=3365503 RepID=UPI00371DA165
MTVRSGWLLNRDTPGGGQTREDTRLVPVGTYFPTGELTARGGVIPGGDPFKLTSSGAMSFTIGVGRAVLSGTTAQGAYPVAITAPETLTVAPGNAQFPRKDAVMLSVYDGMYDTSGSQLAVLEIVQGEAAATPVAPVANGSREKLYEITVPAGASTGNGGVPWSTAVADRRRTTMTLGGIHAGGWSTNFSGSYPGQYRDNRGVLERWSGTAWEEYPLLATSSSGATAASGFSLNSWRGRARSSVATVNVSVTRTGAKIDADSSGNIGDTDLVTIPPNWRPPFAVSAVVGDGFGDGEANIGVDGVVTLRSWSAGGVVTSGRNLRVTATYVL